MAGIEAYAAAARDLSVTMSEWLDDGSLLLDGVPADVTEWCRAARDVMEFLSDRIREGDYS